eukprot:690678-Amorphochlora_amoeboformis.AAC.1
MKNPPQTSTIVYLRPETPSRFRVRVRVPVRVRVRVKDRARGRATISLGLVTLDSSRWACGEEERWKKDDACEICQEKGSCVVDM